MIMRVRTEEFHVLTAGEKQLSYADNRKGRVK
jgi:hypothetical protein